MKQEQEQEQTPPPGAGLDITSIELRLRAALQEKESYSGIGSDVLNDWPTIIDEDYDFVTAPLAQELFDHAPTDIAALLRRVRELEAEKQMVFNLIKDEIEYHKLKIKSGWEDSRHVTPVLHKLRGKIEAIYAGEED